MLLRVIVALSYAAALAGAETQYVQYEGVNIPPGGTVKTLRPAIHWDHNRAELSHLVPKKNIELYYTENGRAASNMAHQFTHMSNIMAYPGVVLEHSEYVGKVQCGPGGLKIPFKTRKAYATARDNWSSAGGFALVEHTSKCGSDKSGQKVYWLAHSVSFNDRKLIASVQAKEIELEEALKNVDMTFGMWQPYGRPEALKHPKYDWAHRVFAKDTAPAPGMADFRKKPFRGNFQKADPFIAAAKSCGPADSPTQDGLPTAACGPNFDADLDKEIGYMNFTSATQFASSLEELAPNLGDYNVNDYNEPQRTNRRDLSTHLEGRGFFSSIGAWFARAAQAVVEVIKKVVEVVVEVVTEIANAIADAVVAVLKEVAIFVVKGIVTLFGPEVSINLPIKAVAPNPDTSPFGPALLIAKHEEEEEGETLTFSAYCVNCGVRGDVLLFGRIEFEPGSTKLSVGQLGTMGSITGHLELGLVAEYKYRKAYKKSIVEVGLPGFSIPKVITIGPVATLGAELSFSATVSGQASFGAEAMIGPFDALLDLVNEESNRNSGLPVTVKPIFSVKGKLGLAAAVDLPLSIGFGIVIPLLSFEKTAALINDPYVLADVSYSTGKKCVDYNVELGDTISANFFGIRNYNIYTVNPLNVVKGCVTLPGAEDEFATIDAPAIEFPATHDDDSRIDRRQEYERRQSHENPGDSDYGTFKSLNSKALGESKQYEANPGGADVEQYGFSHVQIFDSTGSYHLQNGDDGNFGLAKATDLNTTNGGLEYETFRGQVVSDYGLRLFHYYEAEMDTYNVSRFRLADPEMVPNGSKMVTLQPFDIDNLSPEPVPGKLDPLVYLAIDTEGNVYIPITCSYSDGQPSKVFLAVDQAVGPTILMDPTLQHTVTGGIVDDCIFLPFVENGASGEEFGV